MNPARKISLLSAAAAAALAMACSAAPASADPYVPPAGQVYEGITDTTNPLDFQDFASLVGKPHLPIAQAFHTWGTDPKQALDRWLGYRARGVLSISTSEGWGLPEVITPQKIATGDGDAYLLLLNSRIAASGQITYLRPLAEPNNWHNAYSALNSNGSARDSAHSQAAYQQAWKRIYTIVKGGDTIAGINARLAALGMPAVKQTSKAPLLTALPVAPVALIWCPIVYGSPNVSGNKPARYWPGPDYVDWVGTDTYSKYPAFKFLSRHYKLFRGKPFAIGEWGVQDREAPRFVSKLFRWQRTHKRVQMMIYHSSFAGRTGPLSLFRWPLSARVMRKSMRDPYMYPAYTPEYPPGP